jgi:hypothetical protein
VSLLLCFKPVPLPPLDLLVVKPFPVFSGIRGLEVETGDKDLDKLLKSFL